VCNFTFSSPSLVPGWPSPAAAAAALYIFAPFADCSNRIKTKLERDSKIYRERASFTFDKSIPLVLKLYDHELNTFPATNYWLLNLYGLFHDHYFISNASNAIRLLILLEKTHGALPNAINVNCLIWCTSVQCNQW
jgi:hypothetical protein